VNVLPAQHSCARSVFPLPSKSPTVQTVPEVLTQPVIVHCWKVNPFPVEFASWTSILQLVTLPWAKSRRPSPLKSPVSHSAAAPKVPCPGCQFVLVKPFVGSV
jgi:hypothetical protein